MTSEKFIKSRIRSARNISQITNAMQMVAASKMKRAQNAAIAGRPYAQKIAQMTATFVNKIDPNKHPLLKQNTLGKNLIILISTNKGLLGGLNTNLFRLIIRWYAAEDLDKSVFVTVGKKGEKFIVNQKLNLLADFSERVPFTQNIPALTKFVIDGYLHNEFKQVTLIYNNFISALSQVPTRKIILPISEFLTQIQQVEKKAQKELEFIVEPSIDVILDQLLVSYLENQIRDAVYEAEASEHSARMMAMKNATDNAKELIEILTQEYNKARQEKITFEIADMVTARLAVE